jgi:hypothetical protein
MRPVRVSVDIPQPREEVYDFLDVLSNHEPFTDHMLRDWRYAVSRRNSQRARERLAAQLRTREAGNAGA